MRSASAIFGSLGTALYRDGLGEALPAGLSRDVADQAMATLGGAVSAASALTETLGQALTTVARAAFIDALQAAVVVAIAILLGAALLSVRMLRNGGGTNEATARADSHHAR